MSDGRPDIAAIKARIVKTDAMAFSECGECPKRRDLKALCNYAERVEGVLSELLVVATFRGDNDLPHPADDPKMWTARMQMAWDDAEAVVRAVGGEVRQ